VRDDQTRVPFWRRRIVEWDEVESSNPINDDGIGTTFGSFLGGEDFRGCESPRFPNLHKDVRLEAVRVSPCNRHGIDVNGVGFRGGRLALGGRLGLEVEGGFSVDQGGERGGVFVETEARESNDVVDNVKGVSDTVVHGTE